MATRFSLIISHPDLAYARQAAASAFAELDLIESRLSRFVEHSDISRINQLGAGQSTLVAPDTFDCLRLALEVQRDTHGAFDIAYASRGKGPGRPTPVFELAADEPAVRVLADGARLDLGGIGKGFALDRMGALLKDWETDVALLCASTSTFLGLAAPPGATGWPISFGAAHAPRRSTLVHRAFSASGRAVKGDHIVDPRSGRPADRWVRCCAAAPAAALADALSTAFMVMCKMEIRAYCERHPDVSAYVLKSDSDPLVSVAEPDASRSEDRPPP
jgi:thiamine biosynthesis lipoprotein